MIVFLDFDGVLYPENTNRKSDLLTRLPLIEEVLREFLPANEGELRARLKASAGRPTNSQLLFQPTKTEVIHDHAF